MSDEQPVIDRPKITHSASELGALAKHLTAWEAAQLESSFQDDEEDWGVSRDSMVISAKSK